MKLNLKHGFHLKIAISKCNVSCFFLLFFLNKVCLNYFHRCITQNSILWIYKCGEPCFCYTPWVRNSHNFAYGSLMFYAQHKFSLFVDSEVKIECT